MRRHVDRISRGRLPWAPDGEVGSGAGTVMVVLLSTFALSGPRPPKEWESSSSSASSSTPHSCGSCRCRSWCG
jgi:hypothetical protein